MVCGRKMKALITALLISGLCRLAMAQMIFEVEPAVETEPIHVTGDLADDPAVWIHPSDPAQSAIIGSVKHTTQGGLYVYNLDGTTNQFVPCGQINNVDLRYNFPLGTDHIDLVVGGDRNDDVLKLFRMNPSTRTLAAVGARDLPIGLSGDAGYGFCMYHSEVSGETYGFVGNKTGGVEQWEFFDNGSNQVDGVIVRTFDAGGQCEGMVADDEFGFYYIAEEDGDIWKYSAEPDGGTSRVFVATAAIGQPVVPDVEGLTLYYGSNGDGYLLVSSQGEGSGGDPYASTFAVYERAGSNNYVMSFKVVSAGTLDEVTNSDGIDVCNAALNSVFSNGVFVTHDNYNSGDHVNFKLVRWERIAGASTNSLLINLSWNPRDVGNPDGDTDGDGLPNRWETQYFGSATAASPSDNGDGDNYSNLEEYLAGLNPTNADTFSISAIDVDPYLVLQWNAISGRVYSVEWSPGLLTNTPSVIASNLTHGAYTDTLHTVNQGFYRLEVGIEPKKSIPE